MSQQQHAIARQTSPAESQSPSQRSQDRPLTLELLLQEQQELTAVEQFATEQDRQSAPAQARYYAQLLPARSPGPGQQYGFEVDLDRCSGCKSCVTACHALNGLDEQECWRDVGLLVGGTDAAPVMQHVTTACHHCLQPACLSACPVDAYEKDPVTGIVKHLDDQCFGCQYCTLACPYDVPKYHAGKGIVRKCDMCSDRLAQGEAPACVQACPHEAISIRLVEIEKVREDAEVAPFLPAAPESHFTLPTTSYRTRRHFPKNLLPADYYSVSPQHPHWPLIIMLVLTQLSVGAYMSGFVLEAFMPASLAEIFRPLQATQSLAFGLLALVASTCHLGRPLYAFRGIIGLRHSWLSREILAFGLFAGTAVPYAALCWMASLDTGWQQRLVAWLPVLGGVVIAAGLAGLFCSVMIYVFTGREFWNLERTLVRFVLTAALLGSTTTWGALVLLGLTIDAAAASLLLEEFGTPLASTVLGLSVTKLLWDASLLRHLATFRNSPLKRSARLVTGVLKGPALLRMSAGILGGVIMPIWLHGAAVAGASSLLEWPAVGAVAVMWTACLCGELFERYLFFAASVAPRMPGGMRP